MRQLLEAKHSTKSEQLSPDQLRLFIEELERSQSAAKDDDQLPPPDAGCQADGQESSRKRGRRPLPPHLKRQRIEHDLKAEDKHCAACQQDLHPIGEETSERYEYIPAQFVVIEDVCKKYACECTVKTATKPPQPIAKSSAGASLLAQVIVGKIADHLPLHRQGKIFSRFGVEIADQTMGGWMRQSAELLAPLYGRLKAFVLSSRVTGTDDTPVRVLDKNVPGTSRTGPVLAICWRPGSSGRSFRLHADAGARWTREISRRLSGLSAGRCLCSIRQLFHRSRARIGGSGMLGALSGVSDYPERMHRMRAGWPRKRGEQNGHSK